MSDCASPSESSGSSESLDCSSEPLAAFILFFCSCLNYPHQPHFCDKNCKAFVIPNEVSEALLNTNKRII